MKKLCLFLATAITCTSLLPAAEPQLVPSPAAAPAADVPFPVAIRVDASQAQGPLTPIWRFFGADEPNYAYMKDGKKLLAELGGLGGKGGPQVYFRCHHLLTSGDGTPALKWGSTGIYSEDAQGQPIYNWTIADRIFDTYLERGVKPYVQIGFMPEALSTHPQDYPQPPPKDKLAPYNAGQAYPPKDYAKWGELSYQWAKHCLDKYGQAEVAQWYWEVWNEPNIGYWRGTHEEFFKLYDHAVEGVRRALPHARVGGPETAGGAGGKFMREFLEHCARGINAVTGKPGAPLDFVSFHAKGSPAFVEGHVRMGMGQQFHNMDDAFRVIASFPEYKSLPIVIGESDPEGCAACKGPQNGYRNGTMYSSYTAASFARAYDLAAEDGVNLQGALTWAFEFEDQPYFAGFRVLASNGLDLPVLNVFRMFAKMSGQRVAAQSNGSQNVRAIMSGNVRGTPDVSALASFDGKQLSVLAWHYHDDDVPGPDAEVELHLDGLPLTGGGMTLTQLRVDREHSNSYEAWKRLGSPQQPTPEQYAELEKAGQLAELGTTEKVVVTDGKAVVRFHLPRQAVSLLVAHF